MLEIFTETRSPFLLKELEKVGSKEKGVVQQSIKDIMDLLVSDGSVRCEKIGTQNVYWAFPSAAFAETADEVQRAKLEEAKKDRGECGERSELLAQLASAKSKRDTLLVQLESLKGAGLVQELKKETVQAGLHANRWTDNIFALQSHVCGKFGMSQSDFFASVLHMAPGKDLDEMMDHFLAAGFLVESYCAYLFDPLKPHILQLVPEKVADAVLDYYQPAFHASKLPLMDPFHVVGLAFAYLLLVGLGVLVMSPFRPFKISFIIVLHNLLLTLLSGYMCVFILLEAYQRGYSLTGNPVDPTPTGWRMATLIWLFYFSKVYEFADTFIMVLKKKARQISLLHLWHHSSIFVLFHLAVLHGAGGDAFFNAMLNSFIHVIMYTYYGASAMGIKQVSFLKKYITRMQISQFLIMQVLGAWNIYKAYTMQEGDAPRYPLGPTMIMFFYLFTMVSLFTAFYQADRARESKSAERKKRK
ncbi:MAG: hypothetical protein SGCHY_004609 [Lobulomycetales sp.]